MKLQTVYKINPPKYFLFVLVSFMSSTISFAQTQDSTSTRPKIGLVLSGGGAKGFAHIGVLKVLEEVGIRPDIITGTSMGSIMGSLYAVGYSVEDLTEINNTVNWDQLLTDKEVLQKVAIEDKDETHKYLFEIPIKEKKIGLPSGMIEGQHLQDRFSQLFWPLTSDQNFDSLPIPFHCMAVDIISGETVEHRSGDLVRAIRSSMAIPTVFAPVEMDSMLLVDGGVSRNFPVQEAIDMGADIIIGVYVGFQEDVTAENLTSMTAVLSRTILLTGILDAKEQNKKVDILIVPKLGKYGSSSFANGPIIQQLGEDAARAHYKELKELADSLNRSFTPAPKIDQPERVLITDIKVEGLLHMDESYIISRSGIEKGDSVSWLDIHNAIEYIHGSPYFRKLTFSLKHDDAGKGYILEFRAKENPRAMFKFTPRYDNELGVGLVTNFTLRNLVLPASRFLFTVNISENPEMKMELNQLMGKKQHFTNHFYINTYKYNLNLYKGGEQFGNYRLSFMEGGYGINYTPGLNHILGVSGFYKYNKVKPGLALKSIQPEADFDKLNTHDWGYSVLYNVNSTDDLYFPKRGINFQVYFAHTVFSKSTMYGPGQGVDFSYFVNKREGAYATLLIDHNWYKTFLKAITFNFGTGAGFNTNDYGINGTFLMGGERFGRKTAYRNFAGFNLGEILTSNYIYLKSGLNVQVFKNFYLSGTVNGASLGMTYKEAINAIKDTPIANYVWGYSGGIKYNSIIGPIQLLVAGNNTDSRARFQLNVGFPF